MDLSQFNLKKKNNTCGEPGRGMYYMYIAHLTGERQPSTKRMYNYKCVIHRNVDKSL